MTNPTPDMASALRRSCRAVHRHLATSTGWKQLGLAEGQFHTGDDPIVADAEAHNVFEAALASDSQAGVMRVWGVVGEERVIDVPHDIEPGSRVVVIDPLDGSTQWSMVSTGYCVAAISLLADENGILTFECGVVSTPVHTFTLSGYDELWFGETFGSDADQRLVRSAVGESELRPVSLAVGAFKPRDREAYIAILQGLPQWAVLSLGGNPVTPYVVVGGLTAALTLRPQTTWDALAILMCTATDAVVGSLDGTLVSGPTFRQLFQQVLLSGNVRVIPAMIVAKNRKRFDEVVRAVEDIPPAVRAASFTIQP